MALNRKWGNRVGKRIDEGMLTARRTGLRQRLRQATLALHAELDTALAFPACCDWDWYKRFLTVNSAVIGVEQALAAGGIEKLLPNWPERERSAALRHDLTALGLRPRPRKLAAIGPDPAALLGWAYVLEGSRLGACKVLQFVEGTAPPEIRAATQFLRHGQDVGFWTSFLEVLQRSNFDEATTARACDAARHGFLYFLEVPSLSVVSLT
jgi:heme oxygenase